MSFSDQWLALREPYDHKARDRQLAETFAAAIAAMDAPQIADLGGGTGSTARALKPFLQKPCQWRILENDPALVETGKRLDGSLDYIKADLRGDLSVLIPETVQAITASALIDLVPADWLQALVEVAAGRQIPLYVALTYDGQMRWRPGDLFDAAIKRSFDQHQQSDKGFGPALGPSAAQCLTGLLKDRGGQLACADSPWRFAPEDREIQTELAKGYATAALETGLDEPGEIKAWQEARLNRIEQGLSRHIVGHQDILWLPEAA